MYLCSPRLLRRPRESGLVGFVCKHRDPSVKAGPHRDPWCTAEFDLSLYICRLYRKLHLGVDFVKASGEDLYLLVPLVMPVVPGGTLGHATVLSAPPSLDLV